VLTREAPYHVDADRRSPLQRQARAHQLLVRGLARTLHAEANQRYVAGMMRRALALAIPTTLLALASCTFHPDDEAPEIAPAAPAAIPSASPQTPPAGTTGAPRSLTLITGDRITFTDGTATATAGPGRAHIRFTRRVHGKQITITPSDALPLLRAGRIDPRLFDVTALLEAGQDRRAFTPLILKHDGSAAALALGARGRTLPTIRAIALRAPTDGVLWRDLTTGNPGITRVWLDGIRKPTLHESVPLVGAPTAWTTGFDGAGVTVAVLDTGIDATHPDLADRIAGAHNFAADDPWWSEDELDHAGHGTHVASTIAGTGAASNGAYRGVAPGARLLDVKVCSVGGCTDSTVLAGMDWAIANGARVLNLSFGNYDYPGIDVLEEAVNTLSAEHDVLFVVAAGNDGGYRHVDSPGSADAALTVGAFDKADQLAEFSGRGPRLGDLAVKPDLVAPGVDITAARSSESVLPGEAYTALSGTSMATPHVAGAAAILRQRHPDWTSAQLKAALVASAAPHPALDGFSQGAGRLDVARALDQLVTTTPTSIACGFQRWPHGDDEPITATVTYRNGGTAPVTLDLAVRSTDAAMFRVATPTITVPAGGETPVVVTCDTSAAGNDGFPGGQLTATGTGIRVQTPIGVEREVESYDVVLGLVDRTGSSTPEGADAFLFGGPPDDPRYEFFYGDLSARLPRGHYMVMGAISGTPISPTAEPPTSLLFIPPFELTSDSSYVLDARLALPVSLKVLDERAEQFKANMDLMYYPGPDGGIGEGVIGTTNTNMFTGQVGGGADPRVVSNIGVNLGERGADGTFNATPFWYGLAYFERGRLPNGFERTIERSELAVVHASYAAQSPGELGIVKPFMFYKNSPFSSGSIWWDAAELEFPLPFARTEYHNVAPGLVTDFRYNTVTADGVYFGSQNQERIEYGLGEHAIIENRGVFGPELEVRRTGNVIHPTATLFARPYNDGWAEASYTMRFSRDGVELMSYEGGGSNAYFGDIEVPAERGRYRVEATATRATPDIVSSYVSSAWTFTSERFDSSTVVDPRLPSIAFAPELDENNAARRGVFLLPMRAWWPDRAVDGRVHRPQVEVSYDDGAHWYPALVIATETNRWSALLVHPHRAAYVSLRTSARDDAGNQLEHTIVRAYRLRD
jgi:hypothetical protein